MPPKRRSTGPATNSQQSTLAFHGLSNKVTKAGAKVHGVKKNLDAEPKTKDIKPETVVLEDVEDAEPTTAETASIDPTEQEIKAPEAESTPEEDQARRVTDAAIKKYWAAKEKERVAPRVHQGDLSLHEKILREFDMSAHYGVSLLSPAAFTRRCAA